jgi:Fe-S cluster assembly protein SufD
LADAAAVTREPAWLAARRGRAAEAARALPLPMYKGEPGWEFTSLKGLDLAAYGPSGEGDPGAAERVRPVFEGLSDVLPVTQVGATTTALADDLPLHDGPIVAPLAEAAARHPDLVERHLGTVVSSKDDLFAARNEAAWVGGAFVYVPRGVRLEAPVLVTAVQEAAGTGLHWRTLIVLEEGAEAEVWEQYLSAEDGDALFNTVVEIRVADGASLRYVCGQELSERTWLLGAQRAEVARDGRLDWVALGFGSGNGRVAMETKLAGPGADARVTGAYAAHARQHLDYDTLQEHAAPNTTSDLAFRGVLAERAVAVWRGMIQVDPGAQKTDAFQESRNLLLSRRAHADAIPGLEIQADDVRCTHAAAIAQVDPEQMFYLRARGLPEPVAQRLVIDGFLQALVERFEDGRVADTLGAALERRLAAVLD